MSEWRYRLLAPYAFYCPELKGLTPRTVAHKWYMIQPEGWLTVRSKYAWDGASVVWDGGRLDVIPHGFRVAFEPGDGIRTTTRGTCWHDCCYGNIEQMSDDLNIGTVRMRSIADKEFYRIIKADGFSMPFIYWLGVRVFGSVYHAINKTTSSHGLDLSHALGRCRTMPLVRIRR